jgi:penicillin-binding protein 1A
MLNRFFIPWFIGASLFIAAGKLCFAAPPDVGAALDKFTDYRPPLTTTVYDKDGRVLAYFFRQNRFPIVMDQLPSYLKQAFIATEDSAFYIHDGVDPKAVFRSFSNNVRTGTRQQGGSTITQQLVKTMVLSSDKTYFRKIEEAVLACQLEKRLSKEQILSIYLNEIYMGAGAYGVEAAARTYFNKPAHALSLAEAALLAGLPKAPSRLNPHQAPDKAKERQRYVLDRMLADHFITTQQHRQAWEEHLIYMRMPDPTWKTGSYYLAEVQRWLETHLSREHLNPQGIFLSQYGKDALYEGGLHIYTAFDPVFHQAARDALAQGLTQLAPDRDRNRPRLQGALFSMDLHSGEVKALIGGDDYHYTQFNRATQARRQSGSLFKPIVFSTALAHGYTAASPVMDAPFSIYLSATDEIWAPQNVSGEFTGPTLLCTALARSINVVAARVALQVGIPKVIAQARQMGITSYLPQVPSISLGAGETTLMEMVRAYSAFPRGGAIIQPRMVLSVYDRDGQRILHNRVQTKQAMSPQTAYIMTDMLKQCVERGTGRRARIKGLPVAGKTGTSNGIRDAWFVGFTPDLLTGVFMGFDDGSPMGEQGFGGRAAAPVWAAYHGAVADRYKSKEFEIPENIVFGTVSHDGTFIGPGWRENGITLAFEKGTEPRYVPPSHAWPPGLYPDLSN